METDALMDCKTTKLNHLVLMGLVGLLVQPLCIAWQAKPISAGSDGMVVLDTPQPAHIVTGTLAMVDLSARKGMLKTDLDKPVFFDLGRPDQFSRFSVGDRVTVQLDDNGVVVKIIETLPAEVHEPPPPPK